MGSDQLYAQQDAQVVWQDDEPFHVEAQGHSLTIYPAGEDRLEALVELINGAQSSLRLFYYMFVDDEIGTRVRNALVEAARRGVSVCLIVDGFGEDVADDFFDGFKEAGGQYDRFMAKWSRRALIRNHQKMAIVDEKVAMIGGFNIEKAYFEGPEANGWHDLGVKLEGQAVEQLLAWWDELADWVAQPRAQFRSIVRKVTRWSPPKGPVRLLIGGPTKGLSSWARCVSEDLGKGERLDMVMAYFSPSKKMLRRIGNIALRGEARLVMAAKSDNGATIGATRSLYHYLLNKNAKIWEFRPCKLHMKLLVIDDAVYLGSANFDMRSLYVNLELMLRIEDADFADRMRDFIAQHHTASKQITPEEHRKHSTLWNRIRWNLSWFLVAVVDYNVARRLNLGL
ncbi:phosphatidylserine/phosphatidylglycerophosphate/cardiolipin synthase family protein [Qipengyuania sp. XHP0211]|uniref:phospholipase D-like domain-containing protein n=1 Tax=Qipengyuania sp. XHP0211 TaxID=3038079 RepID=UPI00241DACF1|nr:phosphatidylserine/phosphatidylglycerophosphate/cardiolipin synthase family protein [Qipengyuania sp. XHP0211]MDG5751928.1 phosphatidylserine/phosphatidylglycerophosphate/cardiolipin synthase family protein [Qipengyuania sp. XHP0211]